MKNEDCLFNQSDNVQVITSDRYYNFDYFVVSDLYLLIKVTNTSIRKCALDANLTRKRLIELMEGNIEPTNEELINTQRVAKKLHYIYFYKMK